MWDQESGRGLIDGQRFAAASILAVLLAASLLPLAGSSREASAAQVVLVGAGDISTCANNNDEAQDLWISHRKNKRDNFGWETPQNLGCVVNSTAAENGPAWFEDENTGRTLLYFSSGRPGIGSTDIYVSEAVVRRER